MTESATDLPGDITRLTPEQRLQLAELLALASKSDETAESAADTARQQP